MIPPTSLMPLPPWINPAQYRWMENGIVSKVSLRTSQTRKYNGIYVRIKVWGILGSIKCIQRVLVSTPLTSNAPSVASVTVLSRLDAQKTLGFGYLGESGLGNI